LFKNIKEMYLMFNIQKRTGIFDLKDKIMWNILFYIDISKYKSK
jgi:hypothetical protein